MVWLALVWIIFSIVIFGAMTNEFSLSEAEKVFAIVLWPILVVGLVLVGAVKWLKRGYKIVKES